MRVISWNMGLNNRAFAKPGTHDQAWHYLLGLGPDIAFLQECLPPSWVHGEGRLVGEAFSGWGSVIFCPRFPLRRSRPPEGSRIHALGAYLAMGEVSLPDGTDISAASVHARASEATARQLGDVDPASIARKSVPRPKVNDLVFSQLQPLMLAPRRFIAAGDWNTGRTQSSAAAGIEFFERAGDAGWYDCVWDTFSREERTWFREGDTLVQDDHVFCDPTLGGHVTAAWAAGDAALHLGLSDHAPLIVDFDVESVAMSNLRNDLEPPG